ncbi:uncharacterized protein FPRN_06954 [Fusarium proliferatum]|nr:uncharacterized protein FPRN_06954 [Fusarium proliferatum]
MPHNSAVFSFHDDLTWEGAEPGAIKNANVIYTVYGFFAKDAIDLARSPVGQRSTETSVCWGSLYSVIYTRYSAPSRMRAAEKAKEFVIKQPLAVGDDVVDACIALPKGSTDPTEYSLAEAFESLKSDAALQQSNSKLDRASTAATNFKGTHGGYFLRLVKQDIGPGVGNLPSSEAQQIPAPTMQQNNVLRQLNTLQSYVDALYRRERYARHLVFCEWWKNRRLSTAKDNVSVRRRYRCMTRAKRLLCDMKQISELRTSAESHILSILESSKPCGPFEKEEAGKFFSHMDPAFVLQNMGSGWPENWDDNATVVEAELFDSWLTSSAGALRKWIETSERSSRVFEKILLAFTSEIAAKSPGENALIKNPSWREQCWDGQPWLPLFIDWEVEYVHIPGSMWELRYDDSGSVQYGLVTDKKLSDLALGSRTFSGRTILQPNGQKLIQGLLDMMHRTVPGTSAQDEVKKWAERLLKGQEFTFERLDGFTDHLLTLCQGAHAVPTHHDISNQHEEIFTSEESLRIFESGMGNVSSGGLDVTPYGSFHEGLSYETLTNIDACDDKNRFLQTATHGQARITQFKIVDRFGQVISAHDPRLEGPIQPLYPHIGSSLLCEQDSEALPNTAFKASSSEDEGSLPKITFRLRQPSNSPSSGLVGRPVALAHLSLALELATPPMQSQAYADYAEDETNDVTGVSLSETGDGELTGYEFGIKLGDMLGHQDGLIGYFTHPEAEEAWDIVTDFAIDDLSLPSVKHTNNAPPLTVSPSYPPVLSAGTSDPFNITDEANNYQKRKAEALQSSLVTVILDPFLPIHVRSGILPAVQIQLDRDDVERDLRNLGVWFRSGPVIIGSRGSDPVSAQGGKMRIRIINDGNNPKAPLVPVHTMPTTTSGTAWQWVQPVMGDLNEEEGTDALSSGVKYVHLSVTNPLKEVFDAIVETDHEKAKEDGIEVAVALDGYLLLRQSEQNT